MHRAGVVKWAGGGQLLQILLHHKDTKDTECIDYLAEQFYLRELTLPQRS